MKDSRKVVVVCHLSEEDKHQVVASKVAQADLSRKVATKDQVMRLIREAAMVAVNSSNLVTAALVVELTNQVYRVQVVKKEI